MMAGPFFHTKYFHRFLQNWTHGSLRKIMSEQKAPSMPACISTSTVGASIRSSLLFGVLSPWLTSFHSTSRQERRPRSLLCAGVVICSAHSRREGGI
ncbi:hypothetical protein BT69DRAFT_802914 [Atractiella rhizophila]|nr:hypothetical protein BT69DRAFT_802914 [Atractiella rhizophila]